MIFVTLGTQDKSFKRLLENIDKEIEKGTIKDKVIVQAGYTKYNSKNKVYNKIVRAARCVLFHLRKNVFVLTRRRRNESYIINRPL